MERGLFLKVTIELKDTESSFENIVTITGYIHEEEGYTKSNLMKIVADIIKAIEPYLKEPNTGR